MFVLMRVISFSLGFADKSLWDWIDLLGVPLVVAIVAGLFALAAQRAGQRAQLERELVIERAREATLQGYLDRVTDLIVDNSLQESHDDSPLRAVANARTQAALRSLDGPRKGILLQFLQDSKLIVRGRAVISLAFADLTNADLSGAELIDADLSSANLRGADLRDADMGGTDLRNAVVTSEQLELTRNQLGATLTSDSDATSEE